MARQFNIPLYYRSRIISKIKKSLREKDPYKRDKSPFHIDLGPLKFSFARHFGFCFGVENAIELAYRALDEHPKQKIYLLSEMIHNAHVNADLQERGVRFIQDTKGRNLIDFEEITADDIVIIPAFGATEAVLEKLRQKNFKTQLYDTTCPFVERVWNRSRQLGKQGYTVIIHGHDQHEETQATFSHASLAAPTLIIRDYAEAQTLAKFMVQINKEHTSTFDASAFQKVFAQRCSAGFEPLRDLRKVAVVNQTTILATETQKIGDFLAHTMQTCYPLADPSTHFADTRDTLCYATMENQVATKSMLDYGKEKASLAIVVGGYNSSNTSHLVEMLESCVPTYYIQDDTEMIDSETIRHFSLATRKMEVTKGWLPVRPQSPKDAPIEILLTAGASCPDALVEQVLERIAVFYGLKRELEVFAS